MGVIRFALFVLFFSFSLCLSGFFGVYLNLGGNFLKEAVSYFSITWLGWFVIGALAGSIAWWNRPKLNNVP